MSDVTFIRVSLGLDQYFNIYANRGECERESTDDTKPMMSQNYCMTEVI